MLSKGHITPDWLPSEIKANASRSGHTQAHSSSQTSQSTPHSQGSPQPPSQPSTSAQPPADSPQAGPKPARRLIDQERALLLETLLEHDWNQSAAARALDISRDVLRYRIKKHKLSKQ